MTGFQGGYSWNELSRTELQCYEYDYELHLAEQAAVSEDPNQWTDSDSDSVPDMPEYVTDSDSDAGQLTDAVMPRTLFDSPEWYGLPENTDDSSNSASEPVSPTSLTLPDMPLAAAILSTLVHGPDAAEASTMLQGDTDEHLPELPAVIMPEEEEWDLDQLQQRSQALLDITNSRRWHQPTSPLPAIMEDLQDALHADDYSDMPGLVTDDDSDEEVYLPSSASPLPGLMAELQLAEEATPPASVVGSDFSVPSSAFRSADLPFLGEEATVLPLQSLERPGLYEFQT